MTAAIHRFDAPAQTYADEHASELARELDYVRTLAYPHHAFDAISTALATAYTQGESDEREFGDCGHDASLGNDVRVFLGFLGQRFSDAELGTAIITRIEDLLRRIKPD